MKSKKSDTVLVARVKAYIEQETGLDASSHVFVAISGGADSTSLLLIMKELGFNIHALHCNFHLRGEESDRDQAFVEQLCREQDVPLSVRHFQTEEEARHRGISIEMAARDLRYAWFHSIHDSSQSSGAGGTQFTIHNSPNDQTTSPANNQVYIAVAHHRDDQAETLILNMLRGTGLRGLAGMQPMNNGIIRPLLCLSREEILCYLESRGQSYVTDSTNAERIALRNRIRLDLVPMLESINPAAVSHLCLACDNVRKSLPFYEKGIKAAFREHDITDRSFPLSTFRLPLSSTLLHEWLSGKGFNASQEAEMQILPLRGVARNGAMWHSATHTVLRNREALILSRRQDSTSPILPELRQEIVSSMQKQGADIAYFDADLITKPIEVRPVRRGDAFVPFGMRGRKLVSDYLTDHKLNRLQRAETFVATSGDDIIWLIGHRSDNRYRVTDKTTRILKLTCYQMSSGCSGLS